MEDDFIEFDLNKETAILVYLSVIHSISLPKLLLMYEKYGIDVLYFFYVFAGEKLSLPAIPRFIKIIEDAKSMVDVLKSSSGVDFPGKKSQEVYIKLKSMYDGKKVLYKLNGFEGGSDGDVLGEVENSVE